MQQRVGGTHESQIGIVEPIVHGQILTPGFIKSLSQPLKENRSICLEVALVHDPFGLQPIGPTSVGLKPPSVKPTSRVDSHTTTSASISPAISGSITQRLKKEDLGRRVYLQARELLKAPYQDA
ncbi:hypothetical protein CsSME_00045867 [Camellia sinensis var. sinensis]